MSARGLARGPSLEWRKSILCCVIFFSIFAMQSRGQDVAEAARQGKARRVAAEKSTRHVYTDDDLKRKVILTPEDQARVEARKHQLGTVPAEQNALQLPSTADPQAESLGEIARRYRLEKAAREAELAAKKKFSPFPYQVPEDALAEPRPEVAPLIAPGSRAGMNGLASPPARAHPAHPFPSVGTAHGRISPFQPRPLGSVPSVPPARASMPRPITKSLPAAAPASRGIRQIEVQRGQSWWKLAETYLGSGSRWPELRKLNASAGGPAELLKLGSMVSVPEVARATEPSSETSTVHKGDSLWSLAQHYLGRGGAWTCLASANPEIVDYTHLYVGTVVRLPAAGELQSCQNHSVREAKR
jgi:nucleoid-associated protein YgaU